MKNDLLVIGFATASGGIPEDLMRAIVQVLIGLGTWLLTKYLPQPKKKS